MAGKRVPRHIALDGLRFDFTDREIENFEILYNLDFELFDIAKHIGMTRIETIFLYLDCVLQDKVEAKYYFSLRKIA